MTTIETFGLVLLLASGLAGQSSCLSVGLDGGFGLLGAEELPFGAGERSCGATFGAGRAALGRAGGGQRLPADQRRHVSCCGHTVTGGDGPGALQSGGGSEEAG